jgi:hypothetical protein
MQMTTRKVLQLAKREAPGLSFLRKGALPAWWGVFSFWLELSKYLVAVAAGITFH